MCVRTHLYHDTVTVGYNHLAQTTCDNCQLLSLNIKSSCMAISSCIFRWYSQLVWTILWHFNTKTTAPKCNQNDTFRIQMLLCHCRCVYLCLDITVLKQCGGSFFLATFKNILPNSRAAGVCYAQRKTTASSKMKIFPVDKTSPSEEWRL